MNKKKNIDQLFQIPEGSAYIPWNELKEDGCEKSHFITPQRFNCTSELVNKPTHSNRFAGRCSSHQSETNGSRSQNVGFLSYDGNGV